MKREKIIKYLTVLIMIFVMILNMLRNTSVYDYKFYNISLLELFWITLVLIPFILTIIKKRKNYTYLYLILLMVYLLLHSVNINRFDQSFFPLASINIFKEIYYILRIYALPLMSLYVLLENKDIFNKEFYCKMSRIIISVMTFSILILNVLKLSLISYSSTNEFIKYNIFDFFLYKGDSQMLTSRGWFNSANEISAILFCLMPINLYLLYKNNSIKNLILVLIQGLVMVLVGTRVSAIGALLMTIFSFLLYFITNKKKKNGYIKSLIISIVFISIVLVISPFDFKEKFNNSTIQISDEAKYFAENANNDNIEEIVNKYKYEYRINDYFLDIYPVSLDKEFWINIINRDNSLNNNNRVLKKDIEKRIISLNNNKYDYLLGIGYTSNIPDIERDYVYQFFIFGILGIIILIGPYIFINIKILINSLKQFKYENLLCLASVFSILAVAYLAGHVLGWSFPMFILVFITGLNSVLGSDL